MVSFAACILSSIHNNNWAYLLYDCLFVLHSFAYGIQNRSSNISEIIFCFGWNFGAGNRYINNYNTMECKTKGNLYSIIKAISDCICCSENISSVCFFFFLTFTLLNDTKWNGEIHTHANEQTNFDVVYSKWKWKWNRIAECNVEEAPSDHNLQSITLLMMFIQ